MTRSPTHPAEAFYPEVPPISLEVTSKCNLACPYCNNSILDRQETAPYISWSLLESIVDQCSNGQHNIATLHGTGEPLQWDRLEDAIELIRSRDAGDASFATNATLLTAGRSRQLLDAGLKSIRFSLDSLDEKIYAATRGGKLTKTISNIREFIAQAPKDFPITIVLMNHKDQEIREREIRAFYSTFGVRSNVRLEIVENGLMAGSVQDFRRQHVSVNNCWRPVEWFTVTWQGEVSLCCSDQNALHVIGNLNHQTIEEIWFNSANQEKFRAIASGSGACPDLCTKQCILNEPSATPSESPGYSLPVSQLTAAAENALDDEQAGDVSELIYLLQKRNPKDRNNATWQRVLTDLNAPRKESDLRQIAEERLALIEKLHQTCQEYQAKAEEKTPDSWVQKTLGFLSRK